MITAEQYLNSIRHLDSRINAKLEQLEQCRADATRITTAYGVDRVQGGAQNRFQAVCAKLADLERDIDAEIDRLIDLKKTTTEQINSINNNLYVALLTRRYLLGESWESISESLNYDTRNIYRIKEKALNAFAVANPQLYLKNN